MRSPKLQTEPRGDSHYRYYAGYTQGFVQDTMQSLDLSAGDTVLDPWNGAGTTTATARDLGVASIGLDINPVAVMIARSRLLGPDSARSILPLAQEVCALAASDEREFEPGVLETWFGHRTAIEIRRIERAIHHLLVDHAPDPRSPLYDETLPQSDIAATFYILLFETVRELVQTFVPSNPTWIKNPSGDRVGARRGTLHRAFLTAAVRRKSALESKALTLFSGIEGAASIKLAASGSLPIATASVDAVIASPPYCTRLDYVKATLPELAVLGLTNDQVRRLRDAMIGTPTMERRDGALDLGDWGPLTTDLISQVSDHSSKASGTYYRKYYLQYFAGMNASLKELQRVLRPGKRAVLVVQDSFYKEIRVDLPGLLMDMATHTGWVSATRENFKVPRTMAQLNPASKRYRLDMQAVESAIVLRR